MLLIFNLLQSGYYTTEPVASRYDAATMGMFVLIIVIGVIGYIVQARLQHVFKKYSEVPFPGGLTGAEVAEKMLRDNKIHNVKITHVSGQLTDHFNPQTMTVNLSDAVYSSRSVAATNTRMRDFYAPVFLGPAARGRQPSPATNAATPSSMHKATLRWRCVRSWYPSCSSPRVWQCSSSSSAW